MLGGFPFDVTDCLKMLKKEIKIKQQKQTKNLLTWILISNHVSNECLMGYLFVSLIFFSTYKKSSRMLFCCFVVSVYPSRDTAIVSALLFFCFDRRALARFVQLRHGGNDVYFRDSYVTSENSQCWDCFDLFRLGMLPCTQFDQIKLGVLTWSKIQFLIRHQVPIFFCISWVQWHCRVLDLIG